MIINDRVDVAIASGADGIHIGQDDLPCAAVRALSGPDMIIGVSCKTPEQAKAAADAGADYLGVGAGADLIFTPAAFASRKSPMQLCAHWWAQT